MQFELRPFHNHDLTNLVKHANNYNISKNLSDKFPFPYTQNDGVAFINLALSSSPLEIFAIVIDGEVIGSIGVHPQKDLYCKNAEIGYWIAEPFWGHGLGPLVIKEMVNYCFKTFDITRVYARTFDTNFKSQRALIKAGFKLEAEFKDTFYKNGTIYGEMVYAFRKSHPQ